jgi:hypothetical protein
MIGAAAIALQSRDIDGIDAIWACGASNGLRCACATSIRGKKLAPINTALEIAEELKRFISACLSLS